MSGIEHGQFDDDDADGLGAGGGDDAAGSWTTFDAYVDGQLAGAERATFEARLASEPTLAARLDAQRRVDRGLLGLFVVPPFVGLPINGHPINGHPANGHPPSGHPVVPAGAAAKTGVAALRAAMLTAKGKAILGLIAAALFGLGGWLTYLQFAGPSQPRRLSLDDVYHQQLQADAAGGAVNKAQVEAFSSAKLGYTVHLKHPLPGVQLVSLAEAPVMSCGTVVLHARADGQDLLLLADRACEEGYLQPSKSGAAGMNRFRREIGGVVFYELSPLAKPRLLDAYEVLPPPSCEAPTTGPTSP